MDVRRIVRGIAAIVVVAAAMELAAPEAAHAVENLLVTVTNTSANPVPVTAYTPLATNDVWNAARNPTQCVLCASFGNLSCGTSAPHSYQVPSGEELVIDFVSSRCFASLNDSSTVSYVSLSTTAGGAPTTDAVGTPQPYIVAVGTGGPNLAALHETRNYADPETAVTLGAAGYTTFNNGISCYATVSGHFVPHPRVIVKGN